MSTAQELTATNTELKEAEGFVASWVEKKAFQILSGDYAVGIHGVLAAMRDHTTNKAASNEIQKLSTSIALKLKDLAPIHRERISNSIEASGLESDIRSALTTVVASYLSTQQGFDHTVEALYALVGEHNKGSSAKVILNVLAAVAACHTAEKQFGLELTQEQITSISRGERFSARVIPEPSVESPTQTVPEQLVEPAKVSLGDLVPSTFDTTDLKIRALSDSVEESASVIPEDVTAMMQPQGTHTSEHLTTQETPLELVQNLPGAFISRLAALAPLFGQLNDTRNTEPQMLGTFNIPAGTRIFFASKNLEAFQLLDAAANDFEFKTQILAFVGKMLREGCDERNGQCTVNERREFNRNLVNFMHNYAIEHKRESNSLNMLSPKFSAAVGYFGYWDGNTHYIERSPRDGSTIRMPRDLNAAHIDSSASFPLCIGLALRFYETISGNKLSTIQVDATTEERPIADDSVLPVRLKQKFDELLSVAPFDDTILKTLRESKSNLEKINVAPEVLKGIDVRIREEESKLGAATKGVNREKVRQYRDRAIEAFRDRIPADLDQGEVEDFRMYAEGSLETRRKMINRTLTEAEFRSFLFKSDWLEGCALAPPPSADTRASSTEIAVSTPPNYDLVVSSVKSLGTELSTAISDTKKQTVGHLMETSPDSEEVRICDLIIQQIDDRDGLIVSVKDLTPEEVSLLPQYIEDFRADYTQNGRRTLIDMLRNRRINDEVFGINADFIRGLIERDQERMPDDSIDLQRRTDLKLIEIVVTGHRDILKLSKVVDTEAILKGVRAEIFTDEQRKILINRLATVLFMAEKYRGRIERTQGPVAGRMIQDTLAHYENNAELKEQIKTSQAQGKTGSYIIRVLLDMKQDFEKSGTLTPKQITFASDLVEAYQAIVFNLSARLLPNDAQTTDGNGELMVHRRLIP